MKKFLIRTSLYGLYAIILMVGLWLLLTANRSEMLHTDAHILVCGNSTIEYGVTDRGHEDMINLGLNSEHMEYVYAKLKLMHQYNPQIDTLLLGVDTHILYGSTQGGHVSDLHHPYYFDQFGADDWMFLLNHGSLEWNESYLSRPFAPQKIKALVRSWFVPEGDIRDLGIGGYYDLWHVGNYDDLHWYDMYGAGDPHDPNYAEPRPNEIAVHFMHKIEQYCREHGIELILISTPVYHSAKEDRFLALVEKEMPGVKHYNFQHLALPDSCFADFGHVNVYGARVFTDSLLCRIRQCK